MGLTIYTLPQCSTCRTATKWLRAQGIVFEEKPIRETPPSVAELRTMIGAQPSLRRVFNTGSQDYRDAKLSERLESLSPDEAIALLRANGNLVKRPFVIGDGIALVGFDEPTWAKTFKR